MIYVEKMMPVYRIMLMAIACAVDSPSHVGAAGPNDSDDKAKGAATVQNRVAEADLTTVRLSPDAEKRLGIETANVERRKVVRTRTFPGEVIIPQGRSAVLAAPAAAYVLPGNDDAEWPQAGMRIKAHEPILRLATGGVTDGKAISASDRISMAKARADLTSATAEIRGDMTQAGVRVEAAKIKMDRADVLRREEVGSQRAYDEAKAEHELAQTALRAAKERLEVVSRILQELESGKESSLPIFSPFDGILRLIHVVPGQIAPAGAPLVEVFAPDPMWIRTPVYSGAIPALEVSAGAEVSSLAARAADMPRRARIISPGPSADPLSASVDLFFELPNADGTLTPGQRVSVALPTRTPVESLVVPRSAILYDFSGGAWVYEMTAPQTFVRRRIEIRDVVGEVAALIRGPAVGAKIVTAGAAELFGTEFGAGK
jgi:RND family efflux transporter MFP subunit